MTLENVNFGDLSLGFTWLLRLKRKPGNQPFLEVFNCESQKTGAHLWESYSNKYDMKFKSEDKVSPEFSIKSTGNQLPSDSNQMINLGLSAVPILSEYKLFIGTRFLSDSESDKSGSTSDKNFPPNFCFSLGHRMGKSEFLTGTVRAVGLAAHDTTEDEINQFFEIVG
jgi:hypothetical protein